MKTPEQIASEAMDAFTFVDPHSVDNNDIEERDWFYIRDQIEAAIEADRAQRGIIAQVAEVLDDRGAHAAAQLVRDTDPDDDLWNNYIGPMIDSIEDDYTKIAADIREER